MDGFDAGPEELLRRAGAKEEWSAPPRGGPSGRLRVLTVADARTAPCRNHLLEGLLGHGEISVWWGLPKKAAKTFLLLRLAYGLALGRGMWGRAARQCAVLYVAAEGQGGIHGRIAALADALGDAPWFRYVAQSVDLLDPDADTEALVEAGRALLHEIERDTGGPPPLLVVVDTYHRAAPGAEENSARDAGRFIANLDRLREGTGAHVAVIHHGADRPRGSTAIDGAVDLLVHVERAEDGTHRATVADAKDDESGAVVGFRLRVVDLPPDAGGRARTTCIAEDADVEPGARPPKRPPPAARTALRFLADLVLAEGRPLPIGAGWPSASISGVPRARWREECETRRLSVAEAKEDRGRVFRNAARALREGGLVAMRDGLVWLAREAEDDDG